jgi:hypothetical protein
MAAFIPALSSGVKRAFRVNLHSTLYSDTAMGRHTGPLNAGPRSIETIISIQVTGVRSCPKEKTGDMCPDSFRRYFQKSPAFWPVVKGTLVFFLQKNAFFTRLHKKAAKNFPKKKFFSIFFSKISFFLKNVKICEQDSRLFRIPVSSQMGITQEQTETIQTAESNDRGDFKEKNKKSKTNEQS